MFPFLKVLAANLRKGVATERFPYAEASTPERFRGRAELAPELCLTCGICQHVCAGGAVDLRQRADGAGVDFRLWHNSCAFCGLCAHYCPTDALRLTADWHLAHPQDQKYSCCESKYVPYPTCSDCGKKMLPMQSGEGVRAKVGSQGSLDVLKVCPECRRQRVARRLAAANEPRTGQEK